MARRQPLAATPGPRVINLTVRKGETAEQATARMAVGAVERGAFLTTCLTRNVFGEVDLTAAVSALKEVVNRVHANDLRDVEAHLVAHAVSLDALYVSMAQRALTNQAAGFLEATERYLRLALRAQNQSRATLETLAAIKNPPTVFARQANIAHGPQQVNNGPGWDESRAHPRTEQTLRSELLALEGHVEDARMDSSAPTAAGAGDSTVAAVGPLDGTADHRRQGAVVSECGSRRPATTGARARAANRRTSAATRDAGRTVRPGQVRAQ